MIGGVLVGGAIIAAGDDVVARPPVVEDLLDGASA